ncbi:MAG: hypothetical protein IPJ14_12615 [Kineosporiaceae bacterium]|nr:hypothetical protein [Kineosporiaceae bacterium]MBK8073990.1 hypothetical protein [Kineosporiaceae bacterium]
MPEPRTRGGRPVPTGTDFLPWARRRYRRTLQTFAGSLVFVAVGLVVIIANWADLSTGSVTLALAIPLLAGSLAVAWFSRSRLRINRRLVQAAEPADGSS